MKKTIRVLVSTMIEFETELPVDEAIKEFEQNCNYSYPNTDNVIVINTEWRETERVSYCQINKSETEILLKPLKNETRN